MPAKAKLLLVVGALLGMVFFTQPASVGAVSVPTDGVDGGGECDLNDLVVGADGTESSCAEGKICGAWEPLLPGDGFRRLCVDGSLYWYEYR